VQLLLPGIEGVECGLELIVELPLLVSEGIVGLLTDDCLQLVACWISTNPLTSIDSPIS